MDILGVAKMNFKNILEKFFVITFVISWILAEPKTSRFPIFAIIVVCSVLELILVKVKKTKSNLITAIITFILLIIFLEIYFPIQNVNFI